MLSPFRSTNRGLEISTGNKELLPPQDYLKVLLAIEPKKLAVYKGFFNLKFGMCGYPRLHRLPNPW